MSSTFALVIIVLVSTFLSRGEAATCFTKFKNVNKIEAVSQLCSDRFEAQGVSMKSIPDIKDMPRASWDDKCFSNCTMAEMRLLNGTEFNKYALLNLLEENAPADIVNSLTKIVEECSLVFRKKESKQQQNVPDKNANQMFQKGRGNSSSSSVKKSMHFKEKLGGTPTVCRDAAEFVHCYSQKEQQVC